MRKRIKLSNLKEGPIRHTELPAALVARIKAYKRILDDADPTTLEQAIDNFKRDSNPENELVIWERIASTYQLYLTENPTTDFATRREVCAVLIGASMGVDDWSNIRRLSDGQIERLVSSFYGRQEPLM
jgi:hypothetical protein